MTLHIAHRKTQKRLFPTICLPLWTKCNGDIDRRSGFILNIVTGSCTSEFMCPSSNSKQAYSRREDKEANAMVIDLIRATNRSLAKTMLVRRQHLKTINRSLFREESKIYLH